MLLVLADTAPRDVDGQDESEESLEVRRPRLSCALKGPVSLELVVVMWVFPLLKSLLPVVVAFLLPTTDTLDHRRVGNGTHRHGLFQEPMEELPAMA